MDLLWALLTLPYAPVRGLTAVVGVVAREAESRQRNPVNVRRELEALDAAVAAGELSAEERDRAEQRVLDRLTGDRSGERLRPGQTGERLRPGQTGERLRPGQTGERPRPGQTGERPRPGRRGTAASPGPARRGTRGRSAP
ncbi:gas vesicle protein GvpG [Micromonospora sp. NPDC049645]|uniref:gas vesicle protein GvpG n=1 Tax=Micromonospora sp. NPDC049645 TaxID=3155508 RepID=UPI0034195E4E